MPSTYVYRIISYSKAYNDIICIFLLSWIYDIKHHNCSTVMLGTYVISDMDTLEGALIIRVSRFPYLSKDNFKTQLSFIFYQLYQLGTEGRTQKARPV